MHHPKLYHNRGFMLKMNNKSSHTNVYEQSHLSPYRAGEIMAFIRLALYSSSRSEIFGFLTASKGSTFSAEDISFSRAKGAVYEARLLEIGSSSS